jgi:hypothetical protein
MVKQSTSRPLLQFADPNMLFEEQARFTSLKQPI